MTGLQRLTKAEYDKYMDEEGRDHRAATTGGPRSAEGRGEDVVALGEVALKAGGVGELGVWFLQAANSLANFEFVCVCKF